MSRRRLLLTILLLLLRTGFAPAAGKPVVAVVTTSRSGPFALAMDAMVGALGRFSPAPELLLFDLEGDGPQNAATFSTIRRADPTLIVTIGTVATSTTLAESWTVPVIFSMVLYPQQSGIDGRSDRQLTGVALDVPFDAQFKTLRRLLPDAHTIGVLHQPETTDRVVAAARAAGPAHGFTVDAEAVADPAAAVSAFAKVLSRVDTVLAIADHRIYTTQTTSALILESLRQHKPMLALAPAQVRAGALASLSCDYVDIGAQTAELVGRVLKGEKASAISPLAPRKLILTLNRRVAGHLGVTIPADLLAEASEVVE